MFLTIGFLTDQILNIVGSQIETYIYFFVVRIVINLRRCRLHVENLEKLIFVNKNWPSGPKIGCRSPSN